MSTKTLAALTPVPVSVPGRSNWSRRLIPLVIGMALMMQGVDATAIIVALPNIARGFGEDPLRLNLAITAYSVAIAIFIPASAWVADRFGARRTFCAAVVLFAFASGLCGLATSYWAFIAARILQGAAGALTVPVGRVVLLRSVPRQELLRAIALFTLPAVIGPVIGAPLGGLIVEMASWRWIFFINLPIGMVLLAASLIWVPKIRPVTPPRFDGRGFVLLGLGIGAAVFALSEAAHHGAWVEIIGLSVIAAASGISYARHSRRRADPLLAFDLLDLRTFRVMMIHGSLWRIPMAGVPLLLALQLQIGFGLDVLTAGLITFATAAGALPTKLAAEPILRRFGFRRVLIANAVISAFFVASYALLTKRTPHGAIIALLLLGGFFRSLQYTGMGALTYGDVDETRMSRASALSSMSQELTQGLGASVATLILGALASAIGGALSADMIRAAFLILAAAAALAGLGFRNLAANDGRSVHRHPEENLAAVGEPDDL